MTYRDRRAAGVQLARRLRRYAGRSDVVVLGMVRGGVPVAVVVADRLSLPLDVLIVRKLGVPWAPEVAFGALGSGGVRVLDQRVVTRLDPSAVRTVLRRELAELGRREQQYRGGRPPLDLAGRTAIVVDDGLATGASATAAIAAVRRMGATTVVLAVPVGAREAVRSLAAVADDVVCPLVPTDFGAVSRHYDDFRQVDDDEVVALLATGPP
jgi:putative phosphoribosyl transferase